MKTRVRGGIRSWPLSLKVMVGLTCALLPLGVLATLGTIDAFNRVIASSGHVSVQLWATAALPLMMWLAALAIGWIIADRLLVRPLVHVREVVERYGRGETSVRLGQTDYLSQEMTALADAFDRMADDIGHHDGVLRSALDEQKRLTREVHHRVKNNLQIVSSLLSIQAREAASDDVARAYSTIQSRVGAIALVHRWMYDDPTSTGVDMRALASDLLAGLEQALAASEGVAPQLSCAVERFEVGQDTAVPLAFLITELVSLAVRLAAPAAAAARVTARAADNRATLTVIAAPFCDDVVAGGSDAAIRIIMGMARQLRSPLVHDGAACSYSIDIPLPATS